LLGLFHLDESVGSDRADADYLGPSSRVRHLVALFVVVSGSGDDDDALGDRVGDGRLEPVEAHL
jgi:hypothetical protein